MLVSLSLDPIVGGRSRGPIKTVLSISHLHEEPQSSDVREPTEFNINGYGVVHTSMIAKRQEAPRKYNQDTSYHGSMGIEIF